MILSSLFNSNLHVGHSSLLAAGLFHTFSDKSDMTERLLKDRQYISIYNCGDYYNKINTAVPPSLKNLIFLIHASVTSK